MIRRCCGAGLLLVASLLVTAGPAHADRAAVHADAMQAYHRKEFAQCGQLFDRLTTERRGLLHDDAYNAICCYALAGDREAAFARLDALVAAGYRDPAKLGGDADLANLRDDPRWSGTLARAETNRDRYRATVHGELARLHEEDQADRARQPIDWAVVRPRDLARQARVRALVAARAPRIADDYYHAAMVLQHGDTARDIKQARNLARTAARLAPADERARWLAAAAHDRYLWMIGKPQVYGTQFHKVNGVWTLEPIDRKAVSDAARARAAVPSLREAAQQAAAMNERERAARP